MNLIPEIAWVYSEKRDTVTYDDWENHTLSWMETTPIPEDYRVGVAKILLRGPALRYSREWESNFGRMEDWFIFQLTLSAHFNDTDQLIEWNLKVAQFRQHTWESIYEYRDRFYAEIVSTCHEGHAVLEVAAIQIFSIAPTSPCLLLLFTSTTIVRG